MSVAIGRKEGRQDRGQRRQGQKGGEKVEKKSTKTVEDYSIRKTDVSILL